MGRKAKAPLVDDKGLHLPEGGIIELGTPGWLEWLKTANSFRFECMASTEIEGTRFSRDLAVGFTAFRTGSSKEYWNAQKRVDRVLRNEYLGRHDEITYELLKSTALKISDKHYWERRKTQQGVSIKSVPENCKTIQTVGETNLTQEEIAILREEVQRLKQRNTYLENENRRLEKVGTDYSHATLSALREKHQKALADAAHWQEVAESYRKQAEKLSVQAEVTVEASVLFNQLRPLLDRLSSRERRAIQQKLEEILG